MPRLAHVADSEDVSLTEDGKKALISLSGGDMRKVRNTVNNKYSPKWRLYGAKHDTKS